MTRAKLSDERLAELLSSAERLEFDDYVAAYTELQQLRKERRVIEKPPITAWLPEQDRHRLAILGKLAEECNELAGRATRCIIQGLDETDPDTGRTNREELEREIADVEACLGQAAKRLDIAFDLQRIDVKSHGFDHWHDLITEAENGQG